MADPKGLGPTVYVGSYDGNMYAFNAQSGAVRWKHQAGGRISGSSTVIGNVVYFSNLGSKTTAGLNVVTGQQVFSFPDGAFTPIIADYHALYLDGYASIYQLLPGRAAHRPPQAPGQAPRRRARLTTPPGTPSTPSKKRPRATAKRKVRQAQRKQKASDPPRDGPSTAPSDAAPQGVTPCGASPPARLIRR